MPAGLALLACDPHYHAGPQARSVFGRRQPESLNPSQTCGPGPCALRNGCGSLCVCTSVWTPEATCAREPESARMGVRALVGCRG